jgi:hypothetical protein
MHKKRIKEGQEGIHIVQWWAATALVKKEVIFLNRDQMPKHSEVEARSVSLAAS